MADSDDVADDELDINDENAKATDKPMSKKEATNKAAHIRAFISEKSLEVPLTDYNYDDVHGRWVEFKIEFPIKLVKIFFVSLIHEYAPKCYLRRSKTVSRIRLLKSDDVCMHVYMFVYAVGDTINFLF